LRVVLRHFQFDISHVPIMRTFTLTAIILAHCTLAALASPQIPGPQQAKPIALIGATIHPVNGGVISEGTVLFDRGRIVAVGKDVPVPENAERIDLRGKHVYPGLIDADSHLGLVEIQAVRATIDEIETGRINPNVRAISAVNPDSELIPVTRSNGILVAVTSPDGPLVCGKSGLIQLDGWTWEQMAIKQECAMHIHWPRVAPIQNWPTDDSAAIHMGDKAEMVQELKRAFHDARMYWEAKKAAQAAGAKPAEVDVRWEAMIPVLEGKLPVIVEAEEIQQIQAAVAFFQKEKVKMIVFGGYDAPLCADLLKKYDIPVIVAAVLRLPMRPHDPHDAAFTVARRLHEAGVRFCIAGVGRMGNMRNLPYHAAMAAAHGLPRDEALKAVTLYPAQILGAAERLGSLEAGKDATLIVTTGDPLDIRSRVTNAFIQGRKVDLNDRQKSLWRKYQEKYRQLRVQDED
jgi:imidazolonepropionase-like amidohydrolase